ncbi:MAG: hypothetical protein JXB50_09590 [Spirochaetes bacterium]|nr:hypothetical protein [Spirochaetota bacterium]
MKPLSIRIKVELDNIDNVIDELKSANIKENKSNLEITGMGEFTEKCIIFENHIV